MRDRRGNIAVLTALLAPALLCAAGAAVDFARWTNQNASLKEVADILATRGAREFLLASASESNIRAVLDAAIENDIGGAYNVSDFAHHVSVDTDDGSVTVTLVQPPKPGLILTKVFPYSENISVRSTAVARGGSNVCVIALADADSGAVSAAFNSKISADGCSILSNSTHTDGIVASGTSKIRAAMLCSGGGYSGSSSNFEPMPTTDCPAYPDPLADRVPPNIAYPIFNDTFLGERSEEVFTAAITDSFTELLSSYYSDGADTSEQTQTYTRYELEPGVYEGGITIASNADVTFRPGIYVIKGGALSVELGARVSGKGIGFYLADGDAVFNFGPDSKIDFEAAETGPMAGILFYESRSAPVGRVHRILSDDARNLLGTIYLPRGTLRVASLLPVADESAYTVIVARKLELTGSPTLVLNTNYSATTVPVPAGVGPVGGATYLRE